MEHNFKQLKPYISQIDIRVKEQEATFSLEDIRGISSITKEFVKTKANLNGVEVGGYKIVPNRGFAYNPNTARMGDKIPIALNLTGNNLLVSSIYPVFSLDESEILPEYLILWFKRPEFDRYARYKSHGSAREIFDWSEMCKVELPFPSIEEQKNIVKAYKTITDRIALKKQINDNLEAQASCVLYKQYELDAKKYHPWIKYTVQDLIDRKMLEAPMDGNHGEIYPKVSDYVSFGVPFIMANNLLNGFVDLTKCAFISKKQAKTLRKGFAKPNDVLLTHKATLGRIAMVPEKYEYIVLTPQVTYYRVLKDISSEYLRYYFVSNYFQSELAAYAGGGSTRAYIGITKQCELPIYLPPKTSMDKLTKALASIEHLRLNNYAEIQHLVDLLNILVTTLSNR